MSVRAPLFLRLRPDTKLTLDARGSKDPDGDALTFSWFHYEEAGRTLQASSPDVTLSRTTGKKISVTPRGMGHAHIILTVMDDEEHRVAMPRTSSERKGTAVMNVPVVRVVERDDVEDLPELSEELRVALSDVAVTAREGLLAMSVGVGLRVMAELMDAEVDAKVGPTHAKIPGRAATRHASAPGSVVLGGRRVKVPRPRVRSVDGREVGLDTYATFAGDDLLARVVMERMLAGLATRRHPAANEPVGEAVEAEASSTSRSAVSRRFIAGTQRALKELMSRDLAELDVVALMVDGVHFAAACCVVALAITADGTKVPVGLWLGDTENTTVVTALLADLVARGLDASGGLLVVIDGAMALAAGVHKVFGDQALVQRCVLHKRRSIADHLPRDQAVLGRHQRDGRRGFELGRSRSTAIVSRSCATTAGPTLPRVAAIRLGDTARRCWHWAADVWCNPFVGSGSMTISESKRRIVDVSGTT